MRRTYVEDLHIGGKGRSLGFPRFWALASLELASIAHCAVSYVQISKHVKKHLEVVD